MIKLKNTIRISQDMLNILKYPKSKRLFDQTISSLRKKFKSLNDQQLQAFGHQMYLFFKDYK